MKGYLLTRRIRHIRSIDLYNISLLTPNDKYNEKSHINEYLNIPVPCYFIIESLSGETLYISETQSYSFRRLQFNEMPILGYGDKQLILKVICKLPPKICLKDSVPETENCEEVWVILGTYSVDLSLLKKVTINENIFFSEINVPTFELDDGLYILPSTKILNMNSTESIYETSLSDETRIGIRNISSFNSLLKLNKALEYESQIIEANINLSSVTENFLGYLESKDRWGVENLKKNILQIENKIIEKKSNRLKLEEKINIIDDSIKRFKLHSEGSSPSYGGADDDYGNKSTKLIKLGDTIDFLKNKKSKQLITIFKYCGLFDSKLNLVSVTSVTENNNLIHEHIHLHLLESKKLLKLIDSPSEIKYKINIHLGYYLLFLNILTQSIWNVPLPHQMKYLGSKSLINRNFPLYFPDKLNESNIDAFVIGISYFNRNLIQARQYLRYRYSMNHKHT